MATLRSQFGLFYQYLFIVVLVSCAKPDSVNGLTSFHIIVVLFIRLGKNCAQANADIGADSIEVWWRGKVPRIETMCLPAHHVLNTSLPRRAKKGGTSARLALSALHKLMMWKQTTNYTELQLGRNREVRESWESRDRGKGVEGGV